MSLFFFSLSLSLSLSLKGSVIVYRIATYAYQIIFNFVSFWDVEAYFLKKLVFVTNNFVEDVIENFLEHVQNFSKWTVIPKQVVCYFKVNVKSLLKLVF